jgi:hypothetical protein
MYPFINGWFSDLFPGFNTATFFCLSPARTGNYQRQWCGLFYVQWTEVRCNCSFYYYWWNFWPSIIRSGWNTNIRQPMLKLKADSGFHELFLNYYHVYLICTHPTFLYMLYLRNKSWKPECVLSFNMGWRIVVFYPELMWLTFPSYMYMLINYRLFEFGSINCVRHFPQT